MSADNTATVEVSVRGTRGLTANWGVLKTVNGVLMSLQLVFGVVDLAIMCSIGSHANAFALTHDLTALLVVNVTFFITTLIMLTASVFSLTTSAILPETSFFPLYHIIATILYLCTSLSVVVERSYWRYTGSALAAGVIGLINTVLYAGGAVFSIKALWH